MSFRTAVSLGAAAVTLAAGSISPVQAASRTTVSIHVQTTGKKPLKDVEVTAARGKKVVYVGSTNSKGNVAKTAGRGGEVLSAGTWKFHLRDLSSTRHQKGKEYAPRSFSVKLKGGKHTSLGKKKLSAGAHASGVVTAPSGRAVRNAEVAVTTSKKAGSFLDFSTSGAKGAYRVDGLAKGTVYLNAGGGYRKLVVKKAGKTYKKINLKNVRVQCQGRLSAKAGAPGAVTLTARTDTSYYGLKNPNGTVKLYRGKTLLDTVSFTKIHGFKKTYTGQPVGKTAYSVRYMGGDCVSWVERASATIQDTPPPA